VQTHKSSDQLSLFIGKADLPEHGPIVQAPSHQSIAAEQIGSRRSAAMVPVDVGNSLAVKPAVEELPTNSFAAEYSEPAECEWSCFLRRHGRVPMIQDEKKPWQYRGWLLYYRLLLEEHPAICGRWDYWCRTMTAGRLLDEPIPQMGFSESADRAVFKAIEQWVRLIDRHCSGWAAVDKLLDWFLWSFGHSREAPQLPEQLNESLYQQVNVGPMLVAPHDYIGEWIAMQKGNWNPNAFYPTPHSVVECMVRVTMQEEDDARAKTVMDPCVGSGRMLMHASNYSLRLYGSDIDPTLVKLTYVNGALYVPWILRPFPDRFFGALGQNSQAMGAEPARRA